MAHVAYPVRRALAALAGAALLGSSAAAGAQVPVNPNAGVKTVQLLRWLASLKHRSGNKFVVGQFVSPNYGRPERGFPTVQDAWNYHIEELKNATGKYPALVGFDLSNREFQGGAGSNTPGSGNVQALSKTFSDRGGIVTLSWHASNPWTGENAWSTIPSGHSLTELITAGNPAHTQYMQWLDAVAVSLRWYSDNRIPVIWRPFHEMNGGFWWGPGAPASHYVALWRHMYDYFTKTKGLNNLLWAWSPNSYTFGAATTERYPGDNYVDILGHERYAVDLTRTDLYQWMDAKGKVIMFTEAGKPSSQSAQWDNMKPINEVRNTYRHVVGGMLWMKTTVDFSIRGNLNATPMMTDPLSATLDDMPGTITDDARTDLITYTGSWTRSADSDYYAQTKAVSNVAGSAAQMSFTGTSVSLFGKRCSACGRFDVYVDGAYRTTVNTASTADEFGARLASISGLSSGSHTIRIALPSPNGYVGLDYFSVK